MSTAAHTPGPWAATTDNLVPDRGAVYVEGPEGWGTQAICDCGYSEDGAERDEANASLIAAAPELLAFAKLLAQTVEYEIRKSKKAGDDEGARMKTLTLNLVNAAVAKAEGRRS